MGKNCDVETGLCGSFPCVNGNCILVNNSSTMDEFDSYFECECISGYLGKSCDICK